MTTDARKEVATSKKVMDNTGKEFTLFLAPKPIKGKPLDKSKMFGGQLSYLFKQEETSTKCGKHTSATKKGDDGAKPKRKPDFRFRRTRYRSNWYGASYQTRGRGQRESIGWNKGNRPFRSNTCRPFLGSDPK